MYKQNQLYSIMTMFKLCVEVFLLLLCSNAFAQESPSCYEPGECVNSLYLGSFSTYDIQECLDFCQDDTPDCTYFTFFEENGICDAFANCDQFDTLTCQYCYSGASDCEDVQCELDGLCLGTFHGSLNSDSYSDCLKSCHDDMECQWTVYDSNSQICTLLFDCSQVDDCPTCLSSQRFCYSEPVTTTVATTTSSVSALLGDLTKIVAIAGDADDVHLYEVEIVDLLNLNSNCGFLADYPLEMAYHTAAYIDGVIKSCGGSHHVESVLLPSEHCYDYEPATDKWTQSASLLKPRTEMASSSLEDTWLISGGYDIEVTYDGDTTDHLHLNTIYLNDIELWMADSFQLGSASLPEIMEDHCQATLNSTHVFFANRGSPGHAYILDFIGNSWTQVDDIPDDHATNRCGLIENSVNGAEIVLAGGGYSYILNLGTLEWRDGPHLLPEGYHYALAQLESTFLLAGGDTDSTGTVNTIQIFDNENYEWLVLDQTMKVARDRFAAVAVPTDFIDC